MKQCILFIYIMLSMPSYSAEIDKHPKQQLSQEQIDVNEARLSESEIFKLSDVAVTGHIESITEGRSIDDSRLTYPIAIKTSILKLKVNSVLKGAVSDYVYIEYITGGMDPEILDAAKFDGELLVYLQEQDDRYDADHFGITNSEKGVMNEVDQLYHLVVSEGLIIVDEDKFSGEIIKRKPLLEAEAKRRSNYSDPVNPERVLIGPSDPVNADPQ